MAAKEFLEQLRKERATVPVGAHASGELLDLAAEQLRGALGSQYDPALHERIKSRIVGADDPLRLIEQEDILPLAQYVCDALSPSDQAKIRDVAVGVLSTQDPNAAAIRTPDDTGFVVAIDGGLFTTLMSLNEISVTVLSPSIGQSLDPSEASREFYKRSGFYLRTVQRPHPEWAHRWTLDTMLFAQALTRAQLLFVIGHEFGHIAAGHLDMPMHAYQWALPNRVLEVVRKSHSQEFEADVVGLGSAAKAIAAMPSDDVLRQNVWVCPFAVALFFIYLDMFESLGFLPRNTPSHPPALARLDELAGAFAESISSENTRALRFVHAICREARHPIVVAEAAAKDNRSGLNPDAFYLAGEIIANKHSVELLPLLFAKTYLYGLEPDGPDPKTFKSLEPLWWSAAVKKAKSNPLFIEHLAKGLRTRGSVLSFQDVLDAQAQSLFNYNKQWWPFYSYVRPLVALPEPAFGRVAFEDDPSEVGNLPVAESVVAQTKQDLIYAWQLNRNHGILKVMRLAAASNAGILVSDTPLKLLARWLPGTPSPNLGRYAGLVVADCELPTIPTLRPDEVAQMREILVDETVEFSNAIGKLNAELRLVGEDIGPSDLVLKLRQVSSTFVLAIRAPLLRIEREIQLRFSARPLVRCVAKLLLGPVASSPVLPEPDGSALANVHDIERVDVAWFRYLLRDGCLCLILESEGRRDWPSSVQVESPYW